MIIFLNQSTKYIGIRAHTIYLSVYHEQCGPQHSLCLTRSTYSRSHISVVMQKHRLCVYLLFKMLKYSVAGISKDEKNEYVRKLLGTLKKGRFINACYIIICSLSTESLLCLQSSHARSLFSHVVCGLRLYFLRRGVHSISVFRSLLSSYNLRT